MTLAECIRTNSFGPRDWTDLRCAAVDPAHPLHDKAREVLRRYAFGLRRSAFEEKMRQEMVDDVLDLRGLYL